jgi:putative oxidoreductase
MNEGEREMTTVTRTSGKTATVVAWTLQILCAAMFFFAGGSKLVGVPAMVQTFDTIGVGQWFRYVTGGIEVASAALLLVPSLAFFGALLLVMTMVGAVITHLFIVGGSPMPAIVLLAATSTIAWLRRPASNL